MELCVPFFIYNHANAFKVDAEIKFKKYTRKMEENGDFQWIKIVFIGLKSVILDNLVIGTVCIMVYSLFITSCMFLK